MPDPLSVAAWHKTPYAGTDVRDPDRAIQDLLGRYGVTSTSFTTVPAAADPARTVYHVVFVLAGKTYRVSVTTLDARVEPPRLLAQAKRAAYHALKSLLEMSRVFMAPEQVLFPFLVFPDAGGATAYEVARPRLAALTAADFGRLLALPAAPP